MDFELTISIPYIVRIISAKLSAKMPAIGYARVSTDGQTLAAQVAQRRAAGAAKVFKEKVSGANSDRTQLKKAIVALAEGDTLIVTRLDRLARSTRDLLNILANIADKGAGFKSLGDRWADTTPRMAGSCTRCLAAWLSLSAS
jgi:DNA invertase Pin-like site-specific DNA recombinase